MLNDVEAIAQLDWLWSSNNKLKHENFTSNSTGVSSTSLTVTDNKVVGNKTQMDILRDNTKNVDGCDNKLTRDDGTSYHDIHKQQFDKLQESRQPNCNTIKPIER